jgi:hypothetical protein
MGLFFFCPRFETGLIVGILTIGLLKYMTTHGQERTKI